MIRRWASRFRAWFLGDALVELSRASTAERILYQSFDLIKERSGDDPLKVFKKAVDNVKPSLEVKSRRVGGSNYQVPIEVGPTRRQALAFRWIIGAASSKKGRPMAIKLAEELMLAAENQGDAIKKKQDVHRMAEANKAFAHFAW